MFIYVYILVSPQVIKSMDNRGNNRDSDRDRRRDPSSTNAQPDRIDEEEQTNSYRSQIAPRTINIKTNRVVPSSTNNVIVDHIYSYGFGPGVPMKPGGKSAAVVAIQ